MKVDFRLKEVLARYKLDQHGVIHEIAAAVGANRHTIARLYNNRSPSVGLAVLGQVCTWLVEKGVPQEELPGSLFGTGRGSLWDAIARQGGEVTIYLGEYQPITQADVVWRWISRRDAAVAAMVVKQLSTGSKGHSTPQLGFTYVPFRYSPADHLVDAGLLAEDIDRTREIFEQTYQAGQSGTAIIIGSQRVNYLLEFFVADLFGCRPFALPAREPCVPFFSVYRPTDQNTPSCFGGPSNPFRRRDNTTPGLHYIGDRGHWMTVPWVKERQDAGVVIALTDHRRRSVALAVFGFSGRATEAIGRQLLLREDLFWPPSGIKLKAREVGVFICQLTYAPPGKGIAEGQGQVRSFEVIPLSERTLKAFL